MINEFLGSTNPWVRGLFGVIIVFGPLYIAAAYGWGGAAVVAIIVFLGILLMRQREQGNLGFPTTRVMPTGRTPVR